MPVPSPTIDSFDFARLGRRVEGEVTVAQLPRLADYVTTVQGVLRYEIAGLIDADGYPAADLHLAGRLQMTCQRCNAPLDFELNRRERFRFVATEEQLNSLPIEDDELEAVVGSHDMNVHDWIEDEAILSLPLVPRHAECAAPLKLADDSSTVGTPNPFAVLLELRHNGGAKGHN